MLYLDEVVLHNFKSFKHANIKLNDGFNCVIGPNGSGKSNICDALLFALGETSLKRMRVNTSSQLINAGAKPSKEDNIRKAYVKVTFNGDRQIEILRTVKSNKKVGYRLDGKRSTRQEVIDVLRDARGEINETNTITQGEINHYLNLNPKERRELIDIAAGIHEFNEKKAASMRELEKVEQKINEAKIMLGERAGFLSGLEKEKAAAEQYLGLSAKVKQMTYTLLKLREKEITSQYEEATERFTKNSATKEKLEKDIAKLESEIAVLSSEKDKILKTLNAKSGESSSTGKLLEEVNKNIAIKQSQHASTNENIKNLNERIDSLKSESDKILGKEAENSQQLKKLQEELESKGPLGRGELLEDERLAEIASINDKGNTIQKRLEQLELLLSSISSDYTQLTVEYESLEKQIKDIQNTISEAEAKRQNLLGKVKEEQESLLQSGKSREKEQAQLANEETGLKEMQKELDSLNSESLSLREALFYAGRDSDRGKELLEKKIKQGFYGRAQDLCSYDEKHAIAVQAACGSRLNYFIVDTAETAKKAIEVLKENKLGRASFIPIDIIIAGSTEKAKSLTRLIDLVTFDKSYEKAFAYILSNTYLVEDVKAAQKIGIGNKRFVTLGGEVIDQSGLITGGYTKAQQSAKVIEAKAKKVDSDRKALIDKIADQSGIIETYRKRIANFDTQKVSLEIEIKHLLLEDNNINKEVENQQKKIKANEERMAALNQKLENTKTAKKKNESDMMSLKDEEAKLHAKLEELLAIKGKSSKSKDEMAKLKKLREEVEQLKIGIAALSKEKDMLNTRSIELQMELKREIENRDAMKKEAASMEKQTEELSAQKSELQETLKGQDQKSAAMLKQTGSLEEKISKCALEKGKLSGDLDKANRELFELESRKVQHQTRLNDIKAELMSYQDMEMLEGRKAEELDKALIIAKNEIEKMGAVNMKAPEAYVSKKKEVDEAQQKLSVLETEKQSVISMIDEIESKKMAIFLETFESVNENFKKLYGYIFDGSSYLYLQNPKDPFNSGLMIDVELQRKKQSSDLLSGGQKSLLALMLVFAIQMRNPMSFYIFDEIDVALDKENTKKLSKLIKELSSKSQFIVVSHNDSLISVADSVVGVVNSKNESQVVGVQLTSKETA